MGQMKAAGTVIIVWAVLLVLIFLNALYDNMTAFRLLLYAYLIISPIVITKLVEKGSITKRFGFKKNNKENNIGGLLAFVFLAFAFVYFGSANPESVILIPVAEEIFFTGYMLDAFSGASSRDMEDSGNPKSNGRIGASMVLTGVLFTIGNIIAYYPNFNVSLIFVALLTFWSGLVLGGIYVLDGSLVWCFSAYLLLFGLPTPFAILALFIVSGLLALTYYTKRSATSYKGALIIKQKWREPPSSMNERNVGFSWSYAFRFGSVGSFSCASLLMIVTFANAYY